MDPRLEEAFRGARLGDPRAFRTLADHLGPDLVRFLTFFLNGDVHTAHDLAQDTLVKAWDRRGEIASATHLRRWCYRVARCKAITWFRRRQPGGRKVESIDRGPDAVRHIAERPNPPDPHPGRDELMLALRRALQRLPVNYAGPVHLYYVQGYGTRETAELLGLTRTTVKMRLHRARAFLRREIHREVAERDPSPEESRRPPP